MIDVLLELLRRRGKTPEDVGIRLPKEWRPKKEG